MTKTKYAIKFNKILKFPKEVPDDSVKWLMMPAKVILNILNAWPEIRNYKTEIYNVFCFASYFFVLFGQFCCLINKNYDLVSKAYVIFYVMIALEAMLRRVTFSLHRKKLCNMLNEVYFDFWPSNKFGNEIHEELGKRSWYLFLYTVGYTGSAFICTMQYLITSSFDRSLPMKPKYPFPWQESPYYELLYIWHTLVGLEIVFVVCGGDMLLLSMLSNAIAQLRMLKIHLRSNFEKTIRKREEEGNATKVLDVLFLLIQRHNKLIRICQDINHVFSYFILIQCLASIGTVCLSCFIMTATPETIGIAFTYLIGHISELFIYCYLGNELIIESTELSTTAFECGWHLSSQDTHLQKTLIMIMIRAQKEIRIYTGGFGYLSMGSFMNLVKFSFSVYTLLRTMLMKQNVYQSG